MNSDDFIKLYISLDSSSPTGIRWIDHPRKAQSSVLKGSPAGSIDAYGYFRTQIQKKAVKNHRIVWFLSRGVWPSGLIDHIDGNTKNNNPENLRDVSCTENAHNRSSKGYCWHKRMEKWVAYIWSNKKQYYLGQFDSEGEARNAYLEAKRKFHPSSPKRCFEKIDLNSR